MLPENKQYAAYKSDHKSGLWIKEDHCPLLFHSGQGCNYTSIEFRKYLKSINITQSFSNPGVPYENSIMESFFGSFKREALYRYRFKTEKDFFWSIDTYMTFYNNKRPHSILMNQTPGKFEAKYFNLYKVNFDSEIEQS